jgi:hypothetical protein
VEVEVHEAHALPGLDVAGHGPDADGAVAAEHERQLARGRRLGHAARGIGDDLDHLVEVLGARVVAVGSPPPRLTVPAVVHIEAGVAKQIDQPRLAEGARCLLLTRCERAGARRDADHS